MKKNENINILFNKLEEFLRKFYLNKLIKGLLITLSILISFFIIASLAEYFTYFTPLIKTFLFIVFILLNTFFISFYIIVPITKLLKLTNRITYHDAANIIGKHFADVKDVLLNTLQLKEQAQSTELIEASINQKIEQLKHIKFAQAVTYKINRKYLKYVLPPIFVLICFFIFQPKLITDPTQRLLHFKTAYNKPLPYDLLIENKSLKTLQQEDFLLNVKVVGDEYPSSVSIEVNQIKYSLKKEEISKFTYLFKNLQKDIKFRFITDEYTSDYYELKVLPKPVILNFELYVNYPAYTGKVDEVIKNNGELTVPEGTNVTWKFFTKDVANLLIDFEKKDEQLKLSNLNYFLFNKTFFNTESYRIYSKNAYVTSKDTLKYTIYAIKDAFPEISVQDFKDSIYENKVYFNGTIKDDYGINKLEFIVNRKKDTTNALITETINIQQFNSQQVFYFYYDFNDIKLEDGETAEYYFKVWDNDAINGNKFTISQKFVLKKLSQNEISEKNELQDKTLENELVNSISEINKITAKIEELQKKLANKDNVSWQEKKQMQDLIDKQKQIQDKVDKINKEYKENMLKQQNNSQINEEIVKKQKEIESLLEQIMTDEMRKQLEDLQKLLQEFNKDKMNDALDKMKLDNEDIKKELDRNLELFKQLNFEKKLEETIKKIDDISKNQNDLIDKNQTDKNLEDINKEQQKINDNFKDVQKSLEDLKEQNQNLEKPNKVPDTKPKEEKINESLQNAQQNLKNNKRKKSVENQKDASKDMQELSEQLKKAQEDMDQENLEEDEQQLRGILENLIKASFDQEALMKEVLKINTKDPRYTQIIQKQKQLRENLQVVEDSLFALSKRQAMIKPLVNKQINNINNKVEKIVKYLTDYSKPQASKDQQYVMQSINELALILAESLQQMQNQMKQKKGSCNKPGGSGKKPGSKPSAKSMKQMQESLKKQMEAMQKQMKDGKNSKGRYPQQINEQLAKMAAQQEAIRNMMKEYSDMLKEEGLGNNKEMNKAISDMEKTEEELVNKIISNETLKRQQDILTRLIDSEKAEKQREIDEKRESKEGKDVINSNQNQNIMYNKFKQKDKELIRTVPASFYYFYKQKIDEYFLKIN